MRYLLKNVKAFSSLLAGEIQLNSNPASVVATNKDQKIYVLCVILINVAKYCGQTDIRTANTNVVRSTASSTSVDVVRCGHQLIRLTCLSSPVLQHNSPAPAPARFLFIRQLLHLVSLAILCFSIKF